MRAIVINGPEDIKYIDVDRPKVGPRDVLIKVRYCGICGTDLSILGGNMSLIRDGLIKYPVRIGHEWSGVVEEVGEEVKNFRPGDKCVGDNGVSCGQCSNCLREDYRNCTNTRSVGTVDCWDGAFAEYMIMPERHMHKLPDNINLDEAALIEPCSIALNGLKQCGINSNSKVLVIGTGSIGIAAVAMAKIMGASKVMLAGRKKYKLEIGKIMGADAVVNITTDGLKDFVMKETDKIGVNVIVETSGSISYLYESLDLLSYNGIVSLIGFYEKELNNFNIDKLVMNGIEFKGLAGSEGTLTDVIKMMSTGALNLKPLITHRFKFNEAIEAIKTADEKNETKIKMLVEIS